MRRLVLLTAFAVMAFAAVAYALNNNVTYTAKMSHKGSPSTKKPGNLSYTGILHVESDPPGSQPETAAKTSVFFSKAIVNNAKYFPFCNQSEVDGQPSIPDKCKKAIVGSGTAVALAGSPGQPTSGDGSSIREPLKVTAMNGPKGKALFLILNASSPVQIQNAVVPGIVVKSSGQYGFLVRFEVPPNLQENTGLAVALTDFTVKIPNTVKSVKVGKTTKKISYLQVTSCKSALPSKAIAYFKDKDTGAEKPVTSPQTTAKC